VTTKGSPGRLHAVVAIIGVDGAGKTTQAHLLAEWLTAAGHGADYWQNAGGRRWFGRLAQFFGRPDAQALLGVGGMLLVESVLRWMAIARALIRSRVRRHIAVMDRYSLCQYASIRAHANLAATASAGAPAQILPPAGPSRRERRARRLYGLFREPDLTVFLAVTPGRAWLRVEERGTDHEELGYLASADAAYRSLPEAERFLVIDADRGAASVQRDLRLAVAARLGLPGADVGPLVAP
jgi:thymidylate kinase